MELRGTDPPGTGRAAMLHAINAARERLGLTVIMWVPAHRGVAANAYADATAKAYMAAEMDAAAVRAAVHAQRQVRTSCECDERVGAVV